MNIEDANRQNLEPEVSYLYCYRCKDHIPCRFLPSGVWVVECPHCIGECETCSCELIEICLGGAGVFPDLPSILRRPDSS
jgi:hypothetical protein